MIAGVLAEGKIDPRTPLANPLYADFTGFPPLYVNAGAVESLVDNATRARREGRGGRRRRHARRSSRACSTSSRSWPATRPRPTPRSPRSRRGSAPDRRVPHSRHSRSIHEHHRPTPDVDAIVIGAGFGGIYMLHKLRNELGLTVRPSRRAAASAAPGTSTGTPAPSPTPRASSTATPSTRTCCRSGTGTPATSTSPTSWPTSSTSSSATTSRRDIQLNTEMTGAVFDEDTDLWTVTTGDGAEPSRPLPRQRARPAREEQHPRHPGPRHASPARWCTPTPGRRTWTSPASGSA